MSDPPGSGLPWPGGERQLSRVLRRLRGRQRPAVVLGASVNGLSFARSLGRHGVPTLLADMEDTIGLRTRLAATLLLRATADRAAVCCRASDDLVAEAPHHFRRFEA